MTPDKTPSEAELLPCPFCGEAAKHSFNSLYGDMSMASCKSCGATAYAPKWNRRAALAKWGVAAAQDVNTEVHKLLHAYVDADRAARGAAQAAPAPVAEDAEIRKALHDAATSLETISRIAGKDPYMLEMVDVRIYAAARAKVAREAQAAQPELFLPIGSTGNKTIRRTA